MEELWTRLIELLRPHAPEVEEWLNAGATEEQLDAAENALGVRLPDDLRSFYRIHNGQKRDAPHFWWRHELLSVERIVDERDMWKWLFHGGDIEDIVPKGPVQTTGPIKTDWWNPCWVPVTFNNLGDYHCLDLDPQAGGHVGQIIRFQDDWQTRTLVAHSFSAWFESYVSGCESGEFVWSDAEQSFIKADEE